MTPNMWFLIMLGNLIVGVRSYQLLRSSKSAAQFRTNLLISVATHLVATALFAAIGYFMPG